MYQNMVQALLELGDFILKRKKVIFKSYKKIRRTFNKNLNKLIIKNPI